MNKLMLVVFIAFVVWMLFFDENSFLIHKELNAEIEKLESITTYYKKEIVNDQQMIKELKNPISLEKFARETYKMKRVDEDIYIVEFNDLQE